MYVKKLLIENFRGIRKMELELHPKMNVLIGVNGAGKSSVLDALATSLSWWDILWRDKHSKYLQLQQQARGILGVTTQSWQGESFTVDDITNGVNSMSCAVQLHIDECQPDKQTWLRSGYDRNSGPQNSDTRSEPEYESLRQTFENILPYPVVYFPTDRTERYFRDNSENHKSTIASIRNSANYSDFLHWMKDCQNQEYVEFLKLGDVSPDPTSYQLPGVKAVKEAWTELFSNSITGFIVDEHNSKLCLLCRKNESAIYDTQFSGGEKAILALVGSLAYSYFLGYLSDQWFKTNTKSGVTLNLHGTVLIDEIDMHLHPQWQRTILSKLQKIFPNTQFIVTTHSPQVVGEIGTEVGEIENGMGEIENVMGKIIPLQDGDNGIEVLPGDFNVLGQTSDVILEDIMKTPKRNHKITEKLRVIFKAIDANHLNEARDLKEKLEKTTEGIPELAAIELLLRRKEKFGK